mgnify:CR=1 FL=1
MENSREYERIKHQLKLNSDDNGKIQYARFVRFSFREITHFLNMNFNLNDIAITLIRDTGLNVRYHSLWVAYNRALKKNKSNVIEIEKDNLTEKREENVITKKEEKEVLESDEDNLELDWITKPEFEHINRKQIIEIIKRYEITEQEVIDLKLPLYTLKCLDILINYGEKKKSKEIGKLYFGN